MLEDYRDARHRPFLLESSSIEAEAESEQRWTHKLVSHDSGSNVGSQRSSILSNFPLGQDWQVIGGKVTVLSLPNLPLGQEWQAQLKQWYRPG